MGLGGSASLGTTSLGLAQYLAAAGRAMALRRFILAPPTGFALTRKGVPRASACRRTGGGSFTSDQ
jgi:hypothetical protein